MLISPLSCSNCVVVKMCPEEAGQASSASQGRGHGEVVNPNTTLRTTAIWWDVHIVFFFFILQPWNIDINSPNGQKHNLKWKLVILTIHHRLATTVFIITQRKSFSDCLPDSCHSGCSVGIVDWQPLHALAPPSCICHYYLTVPAMVGEECTGFVNTEAHCVCIISWQRYVSEWVNNCTILYPHPSPHPLLFLCWVLWITMSHYCE